MPSQSLSNDYWGKIESREHPGGGQENGTGHSQDSFIEPTEGIFHTMRHCSEQRQQRGRARNREILALGRQYSAFLKPGVLAQFQL